MAASLLLFVATGTNAQGVRLSGALLSEPMHEGVSEADGVAVASLNLDLEISDSWFLGFAAYAGGSAPAPERNESLASYAGWRWEGQQGLGVDIALTHYRYPGRFVLDWNYSELRVDVHRSSRLSFSINATTEYYGQDADKLGGSMTWLHEFNTDFYTRVNAGFVAVDGAGFSDYRHLAVGGGYSRNRFNAELLFHGNDAEPGPPFRAPQVDDRLTLSLSYLLH